MDNKEPGNTVCMEGYAWKGRKELDTPTYALLWGRKNLGRPMEGMEAK